VRFKGIDELGRPTSSVIRLSNASCHGIVRLDDDITRCLCILQYNTLFNPTVGVSQLITNSSLEAEVHVIRDDTSTKNPTEIKVKVESLFAEV